MRALLLSIWREPRPPAPARVRLDWLLTALGLVAVAIEGFLRPDLPYRLVQVLVVGSLMPLLAWRRAHPLGLLLVFLVTVHVLALVTGDADGMYSAVVVLALAYAVVRWGSGREALAGLGILLVSGLSALILGPTTPTDAIGGFTVLLSATAVGAASRYRARARSRELDQVASQERERLARDLHDTVAHHVSAIAIRAQAGLATSAGRPEAATDALRLIEAEASTTLSEMRSMVRVLRNGPAELSPVPAIADLARLAGTDDGQTPVSVEILGVVDDVAPPVAAVVHRLAQESVTNARRHARSATRIHVRVLADGDTVHLRVTDDGRAGADRGKTGFGLLGMAERTSLLGGTFEAGPGSERGWLVAADLPRHGPA